MKRVLVALAAVIVAIAAAWAAGLFKPRITIAALVSLTGADAKSGPAMRDAIQLAVDEANRAGGVQGHRVSLVVADDGSERGKAIEAAQKLVANPRVVAVVGTCEELVYNGAQQPFIEANMPFIPAGVVDRDAASRGIYSLPNEQSIFPYGNVRQTAAAKYEHDALGVDDFVFAHGVSDAGANAIVHFQYGASLITRRPETFSEVLKDDADIAALVKRLAAKPKTLVFFAGTDELAARLAKAMRAANLPNPLQVENRGPSDEFIALAGPAAEGALAIYPGLPPEDFEAGRQFLKSWQSAGYSEPPSIAAPYVYAATQVMLGALEKSFMTRPSVAGALRNEQFDTILGPIRFNYVGSNYYTFAMYKVISGRWAPIAVTEKGKMVPFQPH